MINKEKEAKEEPMTASEHTLLIYLLQAIAADPERADIFLSICYKEDNSEALNKHLKHLSNSDDVKGDAARLRESIR